MTGSRNDNLGLMLPNGCRITHGSGSNIKTPFPGMPVVMHELHAGGPAGTASFHGQFGFIPFNADCRLPRHIHMENADAAGFRSLVAERILVVNGVALTELCGEIMAVAEGTLVDISPGVPHTWTACPSGVRLPDGSVSDGSFLMIYEYSATTGFFPTDATSTLGSADDYVPFAGDLEAIRFPALDARDVVSRASLVWNWEIRTDLGVAS